MNSTSADATQADPAAPVVSRFGYRALKAVLYLVSAVTVVWAVGVSLASVDGYNIAVLELAGSAARAREIMDGVPHALTVTAIGWDFLFIACYSGLLIVGARYFGRRAFRSAKFGAFSWVVIAATAAAGVLDLVENFAMLRGIESAADLPWRIARIAAVVKFGLAYVSLGYVLAAIVGYVFWPHRPSRVDSTSST